MKLLALVFMVFAIPTLADAAPKKRTYNPFSVDYEHRTARMGREQRAPRVAYQATPRVYTYFFIYGR